jgi:tetratricopeptide (TPR) repeat protein
VLLGAFAVTAAIGPTEEETSPAADARVPLHPGVGDAHIPITTSSELAQKYFDQGLRMHYGFWISEARRSFEEAIRQDPDAPMLYWGKAWAFGPYHNNGAPSVRDLETAYGAIQEALKRKDKGTRLEQALIDALSTRVAEDTSTDRKTLDVAYAAAMREVAKEFPDNVDVLVLAAAAQMNTSRWNYWDRNGKPNDENTGWFVKTLEKALELEPNHSGAIHYYIHGVEASDDVFRAREPARRLAATAPNLAHLVHMGSHILIQTGDYDHAADTNIDASMADELYIGRPDQEGIYPLGLYQHNVHFVWVAAAMEGRSLVALQQAQKLEDKVFNTIPHQVIQQSGRYQNYMSSPLYTLTRFGYWNDILARPAPQKEFRFVAAMWHYARGIAFANTGEPEKAWKEHEVLMEIANGDILGGPSLSGPDRKERPSSPYSKNVQDMVMLAANTTAGEIAASEGKWEDAIMYLEKAVNLQDNLAYAEPPPWHYPARHSLGKVLLHAGRVEQAEDVYRDDLRKWPENGWSLYGLMRSLRAQGRMDEARLVEKRYLKAFARADVVLSETSF